MKNSFLEETYLSKENNGSKDNSGNSDVKDFPGSVYAATGSLKGEILLQWDAIRDADKYIIQVSKKNKEAGVWEQFDIVKDPLYCFTGLKPGREYSFRVAAVYSDRTGAWSAAISKKVK
jgi:hypothetical protein